MYFPLFFPLRAETRERFLLPVDHLIQQSGGVAFRFPRRVGVDVHRGTDVRVPQQFLHVLGSRPIGQEVAREGVTKHSAVAIDGPGGNPPATLEETIKSNRFKSDDWVAGERINGGVVSEYHQWDSVEVLSSDPVLRSRRIGREDGAEKMEYTAENPANLLDTLTGRVTFDLEWVNEHYDYVPDANWSFVVSDAKGDYVSENFDALYAKKNGSGYVDFTIDNIAQADYFVQTYVIDGSYETAYYYTSVDGHEFLIEMDNGHVWAQCRTSHANVSLHGAYLTTDEVEDILDNLSLAINE